MAPSSFGMGFVHTEVTTLRLQAGLRLACHSPLLLQLRGNDPEWG